MITIKRAVSIEAPVAQVFSFIHHAENLPSIWPSMVEITNVKDLPNGGRSFDWVYKMAGLKLHGSSETVEFVPNKLMVSKSATGVPNTFRWSFDGTDGRTDVTLEVEFTIPGPVLSKLAEPVLRKINEHEADTLVKNLKATMEGSKL